MAQTHVVPALPPGGLWWYHDARNEEPRTTLWHHRLFSVREAHPILYEPTNPITILSSVFYIFSQFIGQCHRNIQHVITSRGYDMPKTRVCNTSVAIIVDKIFGRGFETKPLRVHEWRMLVRRVLQKHSPRLTITIFGGTYTSGLPWKSELQQTSFEKLRYKRRLDLHSSQLREIVPHKKRSRIAVSSAVDLT